MVAALVKTPLGKRVGIGRLALGHSRRVVPLNQYQNIYYLLPFLHFSVPY